MQHTNGNWSFEWEWTWWIWFFKALLLWKTLWQSVHWILQLSLKPKLELLKPDERWDASDSRYEENILFPEASSEGHTLSWLCRIPNFSANFNKEKESYCTEYLHKIGVIIKINSEMHKNKHVGWTPHQYWTIVCNSGIPLCNELILDAFSS